MSDDGRACKGCGKALKRRDGEFLSQWTARTCCSMGCYRLSQRVRIEPRPCAQCGRVVERGPNESAPQYRRRRTCGSNRCAALIKTKRKDVIFAERRCENCKSILARKVGEPPAKFAVRRFCGRECAHPRQPAKKECVACGGIMWRLDHDASNWKKTRYCSPKCAASVRDYVRMPNAMRLALAKARRDRDKERINAYKRAWRRRRKAAESRHG